MFACFGKTGVTYRKNDWETLRTTKCAYAASWMEKSSLKSVAIDSTKNDKEVLMAQSKYGQFLYRWRKLKSYHSCN